MRGARFSVCTCVRQIASADYAYASKRRLGAAAVRVLRQTARPRASVMDGEASRTVRVSKIAAAALKPPAAAPRDALAQAALSFGGARRVAVLHSKRCALIELSSAEAAAQMVRHHESAPLLLGGRAAVVTVESGVWAWPQWDEGRSLALTDDGRVTGLGSGLGSGLWSGSGSGLG